MLRETHARRSDQQVPIVGSLNGGAIHEASLIRAFSLFGTMPGGGEETT
jgi:hypothetical protein